MTIALFVGLIVAPAYSRQQPLFYAATPSLACESAALTDRLYSADKHILSAEAAHRLHERQKNHCHTLTTDQLWEQLRVRGSLVEIRGVSPNNVDGLRLYVPQTRLTPLEPETSPRFSFSPITLSPIVHQPTLPPDLPFIGFGLYFVWRGIRSLRRRQRAWHIIRTLITTHSYTLFERRRQLLTPNSYGSTNPNRWRKEKETFCQSVLLPALRQKKLIQFWPMWKKRTDRFIESCTRRTTPKHPPSPTFEPPEPLSPSHDRALTSRMEPLDYERYCAQILQRAGWQTYVTPTGSDQGADIIATRRQVRLVVQCKLYSRPVGNKAVQEVFTACKYQRAQLAAVVSNAGYTRHARQLAASTGVYLLHHRQLANLDESTPQPGQASFL